MAARKPNLHSALADLGFAVAAGVAGGFGAPFLAIAGIVGAHVIYWIVSRRGTLAQTPQQHRAGVIAVSFIMILGVDLAAYAVGLMVGGRGP
ncbi:MAG: hypothetical protein GC189_04455 [Alphaproteobacteria bacterium]|nr:hypothetical protein [Alphaproteobacteria bacterium]